MSFGRMTYRDSDVATSFEKLRRLVALERELAEIRRSQRATWDARLAHLAREFIEPEGPQGPQRPQKPKHPGSSTSAAVE